MSNKLTDSKIWNAVVRAYLRFEHHIAATFFLGGFIIDALIFAHVEYETKHALIIFYLTVAGGSILLFQFLARYRTESQKTPLQLFLPFMIQFAFGGIMSGMFVYYFRSASLMQSWTFLLMMLLMIVGNEFLRKRYYRLEFQISVFFVCIYAFLIVLIPYLQKEIGAQIFLESGALSVGVLVLFLMLLSVVNITALKYSLRTISMSAVAIMLILNGLYFTHLIPPIPLLLSEVGIYHTLTRTTDGQYVGTEEPVESYANLIPFRTHFHGGGSIFFFSAISAPTALNTVITHEWQYRDETRGAWVTSAEIHFPISGGREGGYRAYSQKNDIAPGKWRVNVLTQNGQSLGSYTFIVSAELGNTPLLEVSL